MHSETVRGETVMSETRPESHYEGCPEASRSQQRARIGMNQDECDPGYFQAMSRLCPVGLKANHNRIL